MSSTKKNVYVTFYTYKSSSGGLDVHNGFSFCRDRSLPYQDVYIQQNMSPEEIRDTIAAVGNVNKIYVSMSFVSQLNTVLPLLDQNWVIGGPLAENLLQRDVKLPCTLVDLPFETYLGQPISSKFDYYFESLVAEKKPKFLYYCCSLGHGCYWGKCKFCDYRHYSYHDFTRPNIAEILAQIPPFTGGTAFVQCAFSALPPRVLRELLVTPIAENVKLSVLGRADPQIKQVLAECKQPASTRNIFAFGLEAFSQAALDLLNKNIRLEVLLEVVDLVLQRFSDCIFLSIMEHYPFLTAKMRDESLVMIEKLDAIAKKYPDKRLCIINAGPTMWENEQEVREFTNNFRILPYTGETKVVNFQDFADAPHYFKLCDKYVAVIPEDSPVYEYNKQIALALTQSNINLFGRSFVSLKGVEHRKSFLDTNNCLELGII